MGCTPNREKKNVETTGINESKETLQTQESSRIKLTPAA